MLTRTWIALLTLAGLVLACEQQTAETEEAAEPAVDIAAEEQAIDAVADSYEQAVAAKDADALAAFYTDDAVWTAHDGTTLEGNAAIRESFQPMVTAEGTASSDIQRESRAVAASGDVAWETGTYNMTMTTPDGQSTTETRRYVVLLRKVDGAWKLAGGMDTAPIAPAGAEEEVTAP